MGTHLTPPHISLGGPLQLMVSPNMHGENTPSRPNGQWNKLISHTKKVGRVFDGNICSEKCVCPPC